MLRLRVLDRGPGSFVQLQDWWRGGEFGWENRSGSEEGGVWFYVPNEDSDFDNSRGVDSGRGDDRGGRGEKGASSANSPAYLSQG